MMFLSSFFKKSNGTNSNASNTSSKPVQSTKMVQPNQPKESHLPSWKDTAIWADGKLTAEVEVQCRELQETIFDLLKTVRDPEKPESLGELNVLTEDSIQVQPLNDGAGFMIRIDFNPTVPHCSLASLIGLCLRKKVLTGVDLERVKLDIVIAEGKHATEEEINKQINDKERVAAAMENPNLREIVESCITEPE